METLGINDPITMRQLEVIDGETIDLSDDLDSNIVGMAWLPSLLYAHP